MKHWIIAMALTLSGAGIASAEASGRSTSMPWTIIGAVTMKMINSTNMTSTKGVTLMSDISLSLLPVAAKAPSLPPEHFPLDDVDKISGKAFQFAFQHPNAVHEVIKKDHGRNRHCQAGCRGDQGL